MTTTLIAAAGAPDGRPASQRAVDNPRPADLRTADPARDAPDPEAGLATAEYAIATIAAVGFAGLLVAVLKSDTVRGLLENIVSTALSIG
ncbi:DUF4244 domain-containing protein [Puerhibacterium sp. TATVAM-FAB25]|uniref:DUF4244 domain-containing protein n=1 Tax=Puerhibacterium sp. TATVAM-FAB25 TaxID=3093699 RepID=UPI00397A3942